MRGTHGGENGRSAVSMTACRECGQKVSTDARACPSCGAVGPTPEGYAWHLGRKIGWFVFCVAVLVLLGGGC